MKPRDVPTRQDGGDPMGRRTPRWTARVPADAARLVAPPKEPKRTKEERAHLMALKRDEAFLDLRDEFLEIDLALIRRRDAELERKGAGLIRRMLEMIRRVG